MRNPEFDLTGTDESIRPNWSFSKNGAIRGMQAVMRLRKRDILYWGVSLGGPGRKEKYTLCPKSEGNVGP